MRVLLVFYCAIIAFVSCSNRRISDQTKGRNDSIIVLYFPYTFESTIRVYCSSISEMSAIIPVDSVVYLQKEDFNIIKDFVTTSQTIRDTVGCDSRIYVEYNRKGVCIGGISSCLCNLDDKRLETDIKAVYIIKWRSGYFNCFSENDLVYDETIGMFGIPVDYIHNIERENDENIIKKLALKKIVFFSYD